MREHQAMRVISAAVKALLVIVAVPLALIVGLVSTMFGSKAKLSASDVAAYLRDYIEGTGDEWDWDEFASVPILDPRLDKIRRKATAVAAPDAQEAPNILRGLLVEAERLAAQEK